MPATAPPTGTRTNSTGPIYVASRASVPERSAMWRKLRGDGWPIISSWIDEAGEGETAFLADLWIRIRAEIYGASAFVLYAERDDFPLKGALIEAGMAIGLNKQIVICLPGVELDSPSCRPIGSWIRHPLVRREDDIEKAMECIP